ncbi:hypothetical protein EYF80_030563 [Liparis tanakae]|uniref:Uncharacterized protein n=1 Tax=Liparis tanakae TaxID=230148 RepID=A0A4Z2H157_9TELE|nr:hypothetical protein EYF80_030563 [Liparis tanakae]
MYEQHEMKLSLRHVYRAEPAPGLSVPASAPAAAALSSSSQMGDGGGSGGGGGVVVVVGSGPFPASSGGRWTGSCPEISAHVARRSEPPVGAGPLVRMKPHYRLPCNWCLRLAAPRLGPQSLGFCVYAV